MKSAVSALAVAVLLTACASSNNSSGPNVAVQLAQVTSTNDVFYFRGPFVRLFNQNISQYGG
jgi:hypothetical protein